jgi:hypothetical protein
MTRKYIKGIFISILHPSGGIVRTSEEHFSSRMPFEPLKVKDFMDINLTTSWGKTKLRISLYLYGTFRTINCSFQIHIYNPRLKQIYTCFLMQLSIISKPITSYRVCMICTWTLNRIKVVNQTKTRVLNEEVIDRKTYQNHERWNQR